MANRFPVDERSEVDKARENSAEHKQNPLSEAYETKSNDNNKSDKNSNNVKQNQAKSRKIKRGFNKSECDKEKSSIADSIKSASSKIKTRHTKSKMLRFKRRLIICI
jgi:hypothetical protein